MADTPNLIWLLLTKRAAAAKNYFDRWADAYDGEPKLARGPDAVREAHTCGRAHIFADMLETMGEPPPGCAFPTYDWLDGPICLPDVLPNVWLGVSVEDQKNADERVPILLETQAHVRWLSVEPLLGPVDLRRWLNLPDRIIKPFSVPIEYLEVPHIDWVVIGGESGKNARPCDLRWIRDIVIQCREAGVPCFVKQLGAKPLEAKVVAGRITRTSYGVVEPFILADPKGGDPSEWPEDLRVQQYPDAYQTSLL